MSYDVPEQHKIRRSPDSEAHQIVKESVGILGLQLSSVFVLVRIIIYLLSRDFYMINSFRFFSNIPTDPLTIFEPRKPSRDFKANKLPMGQSGLILNRYFQNKIYVC